jgi:hypothetical protein
MSSRKSLLIVTMALVTGVESAQAQQPLQEDPPGPAPVDPPTAQSPLPPPTAPSPQASLSPSEDLPRLYPPGSGSLNATPPARAAIESWRIGIVAGLLTGGDVYIDGHHADSDAGFMLQGTWDSLIAAGFSVGLYGLLASSEVKNDEVRLYSLGATLKKGFGDRAGMQFRLGLNLGYQILSPDDGHSTKGLNVGGQAEVALPIGSRLNLLAQLGFISQPAGGNDDADVTFAPILYVGAGLEFGR